MEGKPVVTLPTVHVTAPAPKLKAETLALLLTQEGEHEVGENWGPKVKEYLAAANVRNPAPWCAAFVNWGAEKTAAKLGVKSPLEQVPLQAYVQSYVDHGKTNGWVVKKEQVAPGDLFCVWHQSLKRYGHIGMVISVDLKKGTFQAIEGNTNDDGSREGYEVAKRTRTITGNILFLRWA